MQNVLQVLAVPCCSRGRLLATCTGILGLVKFASLASVTDALICFSKPAYTLQHELHNTSHLTRYVTSAEQSTLSSQCLGHSRAPKAFR